MPDCVPSLVPSTRELSSVCTHRIENAVSRSPWRCSLWTLKSSTAAATLPESTEGAQSSRGSIDGTHRSTATGTRPSVCGTSPVSSSMAYCSSRSMSVIRRQAVRVHRVYVSRSISSPVSRSRSCVSERSLSATTSPRASSSQSATSRGSSHRPVVPGSVAGRSPSGRSMSAIAHPCRSAASEPCATHASIFPSPASGSSQKRRTASTLVSRTGASDQSCPV